jgi:hypothetical protein
VTAAWSRRKLSIQRTSGRSVQTLRKVWNTPQNSTARMIELSGTFER